MSDWMAYGACQGLSTDLWFASDPEPARRICLMCPVTVECLDYALEVERKRKPKDRYGVFGALSGHERKKAARLIREGWTPEEILQSLRIRQIVGKNREGLTSNKRVTTVVSLGRRRTG